MRQCGKRGLAMVCKYEVIRLIVRRVFLAFVLPCFILLSAFADWRYFEPAKFRKAEQFRARRSIALWISSPCQLRNCLNESGVRKMRTTIKIVKRDQNNQATTQQPDAEQGPEQRTREMTVNVKRWVAEFRERKRSPQHLLACN